MFNLKFVYFRSTCIWKLIPNPNQTPPRSKYLKVSSLIRQCLPQPPNSQSSDVKIQSKARSGPIVTADLNFGNQFKLAPVLELSRSLLAEHDYKISEACIFQLFPTDSETAPLDSYFNFKNFNLQIFFEQDNLFEKSPSC